MHTLSKTIITVFSVAIGLLTGCAGPNQNLSLPSLSALQNPVRVPPPARGSFRVPSQYSGANPNAQASNTVPNSGSTSLANNTNRIANVISTSDSDWHASTQGEIQIATNNSTSPISNSVATASFIDSAPVGTGVRNARQPNSQPSPEQSEIPPRSTASLNSSTLSPQTPLQNRSALANDPPSLGSSTPAPNFRSISSPATQPTPQSSGLNLNPLVPNNLTPR